MSGSSRQFVCCIVYGSEQQRSELGLFKARYDNITKYLSTIYIHSVELLPLQCLKDFVQAA